VPHRAIHILGPMNTQTASTDVLARGRTIVLAMVMAASFLTALPQGLLAQDPTSAPGATATLAPVEAACESADDLRLIVEFLRDTDPAEDGWLPVFVGVIAGLSEARQLAGFVGDAYRPLLDDVILSLEGLGTTVDELSDQPTAGAQLASIGESITQIGNAMDALSVALRTPCPAED
jgi:hypothetical protein